MKPITFPKYQLKDPQSDLCTTRNRTYADVVSSYNGTWTAMWNNTRVADGFPTRQAAIDGLNAHLGCSNPGLKTV